MCIRDSRYDKPDNNVQNTRRHIDSGLNNLWDSRRKGSGQIFQHILESVEQFVKGGCLQSIQINILQIVFFCQLHGNYFQLFHPTGHLGSQGGEALCNLWYYDAEKNNEYDQRKKISKNNR